MTVDIKHMYISLLKKEYVVSKCIKLNWKGDSYIVRIANGWSRHSILVLGAAK